jgi:hydrophobic/amphiphilic exporter-1 (mainly G- bacteria), HAE1 family
MNYFIKNRITAYMLFLAGFTFGIIGLSKLSVSLMPPASYPAISVIIEYPGVSPEKIETIITKPIEKIIKTVPGIESIDSISEDGKSRTNISFKLNANIKISALNVREKIGLIRHYFPREVQDPVVVRYDPSDRPVLIATVHKPGSSLLETRELVERGLKPRLQRIEGISEVNIAGGLVREVHINIDRGKFEARSLSFRDISPTVHDNNVSLPGGIIYSGNSEYTVYTSCRFRSVEEISDSVIMQSSQGSLQRIEDFSEVSTSFRDPDDLARLNGNERVTLYIHKASDANTVDVCNKAKEIILKNRLYEAQVVYNQSDYVSSSIHNVIESCAWGIFAVFIVLFLFLRDAKTVLTIGLSIPITIITVFFVMYFFGIGINLMSLSGLALGAGMIVDNSIVITQAVYCSKPVTEETIHREVAGVKNAIISATLVTIIVFFPIVFGNESAKKTYGNMAFTVTTSLLISLLIALILIPAVLAELHNHKGAKRIPRLPASIKKALQILNGKVIPRLDFIYGKFHDFESLLIKKYEFFLDYAFDNKSRLIK